VGNLITFTKFLVWCNHCHQRYQPPPTLILYDQLKNSTYNNQLKCHLIEKKFPPSNFSFSCLRFALQSLWIFIKHFNLASKLIMHCFRDIEYRPNPCKRQSWLEDVSNLLGTKWCELMNSIQTTNMSTTAKNKRKGHNNVDNSDN